MRIPPLATIAATFLTAAAFGAQQTSRASDRYTKTEYDIPMRDGVKLRVEVYTPKSIPGKHPIIMERTCYSSGPYGAGFTRFRGSAKFQDKGYIFAFADVRGKYMSEGDYVNVRPQLKPGEKGIDESTDTYDTVDYLVKHVPDNNGCVGLWGISYPGFYAGVGAINTHPALKAVSPQAPVSNWFKGDDVHHNGAFFIQDNFDFSLFFDTPRKNGPETIHPGLRIDRAGKSAYDFFLEAGTSDGLEKTYIKGAIPYWNELNDHPNYDQYWKDRSLPDHFKNVHCAVLTVGGLFDAEDMWGAQNLFRYSEKQNKGIPNFLCMGPWYHGMWAGGTGATFGDLKFGINTSEWYRENVEFPFFEKYLRGQDIAAPAKATIFETGANRWLALPVWPPKDLGKIKIYLGDKGALTSAKPTTAGSDTYVNDPANPTPYLADYKTSRNRTRTYMIDDQRWADNRSDVVSYRGPVLDKDLAVAGQIDVDFWITTTGTDADLVVKVIDVWPADATATTAKGDSMANYEQELRADIMRCRFRDSFENPKPIVPGQPTRVHFKLNDVLHKFLKGHRIMVQVQSDWFPLVDRNPNNFVDIYKAKPSDFQKATIAILRDPKHPSSITFGEFKDDATATVLH